MRNLVATLIAGAASTVTAFGIPSAIADDETKIDPHVAWVEVHFDFDSTELSPTARAQLDKAAAWIKQNPDATILIEGHADKVGSAPYNKRLAQRRAETARLYLIDQGVPLAQVRILAYGEGMPAFDTTKESRLNRRIALVAVEKEPIVEVETRTVRVDVPVERTVYVPKTVRVDRPVPAPRKPLELDVMAGGGVTGFIEDQTREVTDVGGMWTARVVGRTQRILGYEAAYVGSAQDVQHPSMGSSATVIGHGFEGNLRLNLTQAAMFQPYVFGGVGWTQYDVSSIEASSPDMREDDQVINIPAGVGLRLALPQRLILDLRGTYRAAIDDTMLDGMGGTEHGLETWSAAGQIGMTF